MSEGNYGLKAAVIKQITNLLQFYFGNRKMIAESTTMVKGRRLIITRKDHTRMVLNCDGDGFSPQDTTLDIRLIPSGVNFVAPEHTSLLLPVGD